MTLQAKSNTVSKTDVGLAISATTLDAVGSLSKHSQVPLLGEVVTVAASLIHVAREIRRHRKSCIELIEQSCELATSVVNSCAGNDTLTKQFENDIANFIESLQKVEKLCLQISQKGWLKLALTHYIIKEQIEGLKSQLRVVEQSFLILNVLKTRQVTDNILDHMKSAPLIPHAQEPTTYSTTISNSNFGNISNVSNVGVISQNF